MKMPLPRYWLSCLALALAGVQPAAWSMQGCSEEPLLRQAAAQLRGQFGERCEVCALGSLPEQVCTGAVADISIGAAGAPNEGRVAARASLRCADGTVRSLPLWFQVAAPRLTPRARRPLVSGTSVEPSDFEWVERMQPLPGDGWSADGWTAGSKRLVRPLRAGDVLHARYLRSSAAVESGARVEAALVQGKVSLRLDAIAMGEGAPGERIRVKRGQDGKSMPARVTGSNSVELLP
ncbi:flagellar basal body P-ring formation chaperone FlgA [Solimonas sp. SE-A11]|uniref:flagellar basal body P-ring formation chaperone FlgA n=1 Tax=Solimonas sp. SE-A11 TaxID=3054954 RepID=UPI00259CBCBA|nr:flagellar basal body P-ring formation chaperone FlgA [Solimonas sp. SE-A11]MDM4772906.1 flagellar basal body P-ring formation chaperone FlgA [Solimonas sp. SE-A11]